MTDTTHNKITDLIEQRIRAQVQAEVEPSIAAFHELVKAAIAKLDLSTITGPEYQLVEYVRKHRVEQLVDHRINKIVEQLVQGEQRPAHFEPAAVAAFQVGDRVMLNSGGPEMTVSRIGEGGEVRCQWENANLLSVHGFPQVCLTLIRARNAANSHSNQRPVA